MLRDGVQVAEIDLPGGLRYSDNGLTPSTTYRYTIEAVDSAGNVSAPTTNKAASTRHNSGGGHGEHPAWSVSVRRHRDLGHRVVVDEHRLPTAPSHYGAGVAHFDRERSGRCGATPRRPAVQSHRQRTSYQYTVGDGTVTRPRRRPSATAAAPGGTYSFAAIGDFGGGSPGESQNAANIAADGHVLHPDPRRQHLPLERSDPTRTSRRCTPTSMRGCSSRSPQPSRTQPFFPANGNQEYYSRRRVLVDLPDARHQPQLVQLRLGRRAHPRPRQRARRSTRRSPQYAFAQSDLAAHQARSIAASSPCRSRRTVRPRRRSSARFVRQST